MTVQQPPFIVAALVRLITTAIPAAYHVIGVSVAEHFLLHADVPGGCVIQHAAVNLMDACLRDFDGRPQDLRSIVHVDLDRLAPVLLQLSFGLHTATPSVLLEKLFAISGIADGAPVSALVEQFFALWRSAQASDDLETAPALLQSVVALLEIVSDDGLALLAPAVLAQLHADLTEFRSGESLADQLEVAAVITRRVPLFDPLLNFVAEVFALDLDFVGVLPSVALLLAPIVLAERDPARLAQFAELCHTWLQPDTDAESLAHACVLAACIIHAGGAPFFAFVTAAAEALLARQKAVVLAGALYVFAAALIAGGGDAAQMLSADVRRVIVAGVAHQDELAYREIKLAVIVLAWLGSTGSGDAFPVALDLVLPLVGMKALDGTAAGSRARRRVHVEAGLLSLTPLLAMPTDDWDEFRIVRELGGEELWAVIAGLANG
jgi:hypothetical protein